MSRPRKPTAILELNGAFKKDPQRRAAREHEPKSNSPLGDPPVGFDKNEKAMWFELADIAPAKVLTGADRWIVEVCCKIMAKVREDGIGGRHGVPVGELSQLTAGLRTMGLTPADRSKISVAPDEKAANPFAEIAQESKSPRPN